jgi:hypothetical protein
MKRAARHLAGIIWLGLSSSVFALPITQTIGDTYQGSNDHGWGDVIGDKNIFQVDHMDVTIDDDLIAVKVVTKFKENPSAWYSNIKYGDLFISDNGWSAFGSAPYLSDNHTNGEKWEFIVDTKLGGIYENNGYKISDNVNRYGTFRNGQEVLRDARKSVVSRGQASVAIQGETIDGQLWNTLTYTMSLSALGIIEGDSVGFKWGMTCANDTIEGQVEIPVTPNELPEPASLTLFATGVVGLAMRRRRSVTKK